MHCNSGELHLYLHNWYNFTSFDGNLGGFFGPWYVGVMKDMTGSCAGGLYGLAFLGLISSLVCAFFLDVQAPSAKPRRIAPLKAHTT